MPGCNTEGSQPIRRSGSSEAVSAMQRRRVCYQIQGIMMMALWSGLMHTAHHKSHAVARVWRLYSELISNQPSLKRKSGTNE